MTTIHRRGALGALAITSALAGMAGTAGAAPSHLRGTVVHDNARAHSFVIADPSGRLYAVHGPAAQIGRTVAVTASPLRDGTFALDHSSVGRAQRHVRIRGVVTFANLRKGTFAVSAPGVSMLVVRGHRARFGRDVTPAVGSEVVATGTVDNSGDLDEQSVETVGHDTGIMDLEGTILAVDPSARTITVSADDEDQSGQSVTVSIPSSFDITRYTQGREVELSVQPTGTGTATLVGSCEDSNAESANSSSDCQGDVGDDQGEQEEGQSGSQAEGHSGSQADEERSSRGGSGSHPVE